MKLVKSLLLGSAAGLSAVAGAQAADLPVRKAAPVEYVRVCTAYGAGYFYIPGTDTCLRVGGRARFEYHYSSNLNRNTTNGDVSGYRAIGRLNLDARTQTAYGTLRTFVRFDIASRTGAYLTSGTQQRYANAFPALGQDTFGRAQKFVDIDKAFVQFAGFTAGRAASFYDFYAGDFELIGNSVGSNVSSTNLLAYTATFGQGFSATISMEDPTFRRQPIYSAAAAALGSTAFNAFTSSAALAPIGVATTDAFGNPVVVTVGDVTQKNRLPDFVGALRYDAPWGSAQISAAVHELNIGSATNQFVGGVALPTTTQFTTARVPNEYGWGVQGGLKVNTPFIAPGDALYLQGSYAEGAMQYTGVINPIAGEIGAATLFSGAKFPVSLNDAVVNPFTNRLALSTSFSVLGSYLHYWAPEWRSAIFGSYGELRYDKAARVANGVVGFGLPTLTLPAPTAAQLNAFNFSAVQRDFNVLYVGASLIWSPVRDLDIGVEGVYQRVALNNGRTNDLNKNPNGYVVAGTTTPIATANSTDNFLFRFRVQRDF